MSQIKLSNYYIKNIVKLALNEDLYPSGDITSSLVKNKNYKDKKIWFAGSDAEDISKYTKELDQKFNNNKDNFTWKYSDEPNEQHNTIFRATKEKALIWTLNK